jgi:hypothetical protein
MSGRGGEETGIRYGASETNGGYDTGVRDDGRGSSGSSARKSGLETYYQPAFAGSRVDYDRPSLEAIGSGEGAQAHGWGLYYALDRDIAEEYRETFLRQSTNSITDAFKVFTANGVPFLKAYKVEPTEKLLGLLRYSNELGNHGPLLRYVEGKIDQFKLFKEKGGDDRGLLDGYQKLYDDINSKGSKLVSQGQVHEVDIPENPYLLDEDLYFRHQSEFVQSKIKELVEKEGLTEKFEIYQSEENPKYNILENSSGKEIYEIISEALGSDKDASLLLNKYGIKGITYEGRQDGRCFVIFDPDDVKVIQKFYQDQTNPNGPRGAYQNSIIYLFENADASTIIHELGHFLAAKASGVRVNEFALFMGPAIFKKQVG